MGFDANQVRALSFYDFAAAWAGYRKANGLDADGPALTPSEETALAAAIDQPLLWN